MSDSQTPPPVTAGVVDRPVAADPDEEWLMRPFDFARSRPNPYAERLRKADCIRIYARLSDGSEELLHEFGSYEDFVAGKDRAARQPGDRTDRRTEALQVTLEPEVAHYFPDSAAVNDALRPLARVLEEREKAAQAAAPAQKQAAGKGR